MQSLIIKGIDKEWNALNHLQTWVSKNAKTYFGSEKYLKAEGCVRDGLVALGSVKMGSMEGSVSDGNGSSGAVNLAQYPGTLTATCDCLVVKSEDRGMKKEEHTDEADSTCCHHLAAFLLHISKVNADVTSPFICGDSDNNFSFKGYLAAFKSREELIELCTQYASAAVQREARVDVGKKRGVLTKDLTKIQQAIEKVLSKKINLKFEDPIEISNGLAVPMKKLVPFYTTQPEGVLIILKMIFTFIRKADLEVYYEDPGEEVDPDEEEDRSFDYEMILDHFINFILAQPDAARGDALVKLFASYWESKRSYDEIGSRWVGMICKLSDTKIGAGLINALVSPEIQQRLHSSEKASLLTRFAKNIPSGNTIPILEGAANTLNDKAVELMKLYIEQKEETKAITWLDARLASWIQPPPTTTTRASTVARTVNRRRRHGAEESEDDGLGEESPEDDAEESDQLPSGDDNDDDTDHDEYVPNDDDHFKELLFIRAKLAGTFEKNKSIELRWLKAIMKNEASETTLRRVCEMRPNCKLAFESIYVKADFRGFLETLESLKRYPEIAAVMSRDLERVLKSNFNVVEYLIRHPQGVIDVEEYLIRTIRAEINKVSNSKYECCIPPMKALKRVAPTIAKAEIARIRTQHKAMKNLIKLMDKAKLI